MCTRTALIRAVEIVSQQAGLPKPSQAELARRMNVTPQAITNWMSGGLTAERAAQIELMLEGKVTARDLLPDFPWPKVA